MVVDFFQDKEKHNMRETKTYFLNHNVLKYLFTDTIDKNVKFSYHCATNCYDRLLYFIIFFYFFHLENEIGIFLEE